MQKHDVALPSFACSTSRRRSLSAGRWRLSSVIAPIVADQFRAHDDVAQILRARQLRYFFGVFRLVIDAVGRPEQQRFTPSVLSISRWVRLSSHLI